MIRTEVLKLPGAREEGAKMSGEEGRVGVSKSRQGRRSKEMTQLNTSFNGDQK